MIGSVDKVPLVNQVSAPNPAKVGIWIAHAKVEVRVEKLNEFSLSIEPMPYCCHLSPMPKPPRHSGETRTPARGKRVRWHASLDTGAGGGA